MDGLSRHQMEYYEYLRRWRATGEHGRRLSWKDFLLAQREFLETEYLVAALQERGQTGEPYRKMVTLRDQLRSRLLLDGDGHVWYHDQSLDEDVCRECGILRRWLT